MAHGNFLGDSFSRWPMMAACLPQKIRNRIALGIDIQAYLFSTRCSNQANDPSATIERNDQVDFKVLKSERRARPIIFFA
jgi:hypothetical protein